MRLRLRLLLLIALLISAALTGSFALIFSAVRQQSVADLDRSLEVAANLWNLLTQSQARSLAASASSLAGESGFVTVFRGTDVATLLDYLRAAQQNNPILDLTLVVDGSGKVLADTDPGDPPKPEGLLNNALAGETGAAFWSRGQRLYLAAAAPIWRGQDQVDGAVLLGMRMDEAFLQQMSQDTGTEMALEGLGAAPLSSESLRIRRVELKDGQGQQVARLRLVRRLDQALAYMNGVRQQLWLLGGVVLGVALLLSLPLVHRLTESVIALEKAQAELEAIFLANQDGLAALDQQGRIVMANPAAALCLGEENCKGKLLPELLPEEAHLQLISGGSSLFQSCSWEREGYRFLLTRTFVVRGDEQWGSILVLRHSTPPPGVPAAEPGQALAEGAQPLLRDLDHSLSEWTGRSRKGSPQSPLAVALPEWKLWVLLALLTRAGQPLDWELEPGGATLSLAQAPDLPPEARRQLELLLQEAGGRWPEPTRIWLPRELC